MKSKQFRVWACSRSNIRQKHLSDWSWESHKQIVLTQLTFACLHRVGLQKRGDVSKTSEMCWSKSCVYVAQLHLRWGTTLSLVGEVAQWVIRWKRCNGWVFALWIRSAKIPGLFERKSLALEFASSSPQVQSFYLFSSGVNYLFQSSYFHGAVMTRILKKMFLFLETLAKHGDFWLASLQ